MKEVLIGTSGYNYDHWIGLFYPNNIKKSKWLEYYTQFFDTVELNVTFYRLPQVNAFLSWYKRTPKNFSFAIKGSRFITHVKRLKDAKEALELFFSRAEKLKEKLKVVLWQLPPRCKLDKIRFEEFVNQLNRFSYTKHVFEFRDESFLCSFVFSLLKENKMSICIADYPEFNKSIPNEFNYIYIRRHGPHLLSGLYSACYSDDQLKNDAKNIKKYLKEGKDVFVYFNNDAQAYAIKNALRLKELV